MKKTALRRMIYKEIWTSKARFLSILVLILLGVGFFSGLQATGPNMLKTADHYFDQQRLYDIHVQSTMGLEEGEFDRLSDYQGVDQIELGYAQDVLAGENRLVMKVIGYNPEHQLNAYVVNDGRLPEQSGEIALDNHESIKNQYQIGDHITLYPNRDETDLDEQFNVTTFEVVGFVTSPRYITEDSRGQTTIGRGRLDAFAVILDEDFNLPVYTDLFATFSNLREVDSFSEAYQSHSRHYQTEFDHVLEAYGSERMAEIWTEAEREIAEAETEMAKGKSELDEARVELDDARDKIEDGQNALAEAETELNDALAELEVGEREYEEGLATFETEIANGEHQLDEGRIELDEQQGLLDQKRVEVEQGAVELAYSRGQVESARETLINLNEEVVDWIQQLNQFFDVPTDRMTDEIRESILEDFDAIDLDDHTLADLLDSYFAEQISFDQVQVALNEMIAEFEAEIAELDQAMEEIEAHEAELATGRAELNAGQEELNQARQTLNEQVTQLERERLKGRAELEEARRDLDRGWREYEEGQATLEIEQEKLNEAVDEYEEGVKTFEEEQADALKEIAEAENEIAEARAELEDLEEPTYYTFIREDNGAFVEYADNADRLSDLATIFPVVFFAIAALVTLTTITRMIEEQRGEIGTLKALGYLNKEVSLKYYVYAISASLAGTILGLLLGYLLLPRIIYDAYRILYNLPDLVLSNYWSYTLISSAIAIISTVLTAWVVLRVDLRSSPAVLMRPRAPKVGKRILLERITPVWNKLNFIEKVTARNLFRYKQRMLMTVFGIAGCAALIITGFGLKGAVEGITALQFGEVMHYNAMVILDDEATEDETAAYGQLLERYDGIDQRLAIYQTQYEVGQTGMNTQDLNVIVPEYPDQLTDFIQLKDRTSDDQYQLTDEGAIVTEKLADLFDLSKGDKLTFTDPDNEAYEIEITEIAENYTGHYLYLTEAVYRERVRDEPINFNAELLMYQQDRHWEDVLSERLMEEDHVITVTFNASMIETFEDSMESLNIVVVVLIIAAAGLALVVLYNLTNINVSERIRELSTIKVLGFYDREVTMYIYRENIILTLMGIAAGSILGRFLHVFVLETASMDNMMFNPALHWSSYLYSTVLTFVFSTFVMWIMHRKLKAVDMIEALKSNE